MCRGTPAGLQAPALTMPPQRRPSPMWGGCVEAGDIAAFLAGHRPVVELSNNEPLRDDHISLLPPDAFHLPVARPVTHKIYRDADHPSRLVLPFTTRPSDRSSAAPGDARASRHAA
jgi:hypothetical protein